MDSVSGRPLPKQGHACVSVRTKIEGRSLSHSPSHSLIRAFIFSYLGLGFSTWGYAVRLLDGWTDVQVLFVVFFAAFWFLWAALLLPFAGWAKGLDYGSL